MQEMLPSLKPAIVTADDESQVAVLARLPATQTHSKFLGQNRRGFHLWVNKHPGDLCSRALCPRHVGNTHCQVRNLLAMLVFKCPPSSVRWDPPETLVSYAYSKTFCNKTGSHFVLMCEKGNVARQRTVFALRGLDPSIKEWAEQLSDGKPCSPPSESLDWALEPDISRYDYRRMEEFIEDPVTGWRIYVTDAFNVICHLKSAGSPSHPTRPLFSYTGSPIVCTLYLPPASPLRIFSGKPSTSRPMALRVACFGACQELFAMRAIDSGCFFSRPEHLPPLRMQTIGDPV